MTPGAAPKKRSKALLVLAAMGPGIIAAMAGNDAGGIATYSMAGSQFGYATLWLFPLMALLLGIIQESIARMGTKTGKGLSALIRERFGIRLTSFAMLALLVANIATILSQFAGVAAGMELFGVSKYISVPVAALAVWLLVVGGSYKRVEKVLLVISLLLLAYIAAAIMAKPDWGQVALGTVKPVLLTDRSYLSLAVAMVGTTIAPWMLFFTQSTIVDRGATVEDLGYQRIDVISGVVVAVIVAWFIVITTGATLFPQGITVDDASVAASALEPVAGHYASQIFAVGLVAASLLAACTLPLTTSYAVCEAFGWERSADSTWSEAPQFKTIITVSIALSAAVVLIPDLNLMFIMVLAQFINGALLPVLLVFMVVLVNDKRLMGHYANGKLSNILYWFTIIVVGVLTIALLVMQVLGIG